MTKEEIGDRLLLSLDITPEEYLPALLEIVRGFRLGALKPADESFIQVIRDVINRNTRPVCQQLLKMV